MGARISEVAHCVSEKMMVPGKIKPIYSTSVLPHGTCAGTIYYIVFHGGLKSLPVSLLPPDKCLASPTTSRSTSRRPSPYCTHYVAGPLASGAFHARVYALLVDRS